MGVQLNEFLVFVFLHHDAAVENKISINIPDGREPVCNVLCDGCCAKKDRLLRHDVQLRAVVLEVERFDVVSVIPKAIFHAIEAFQ